MDTDTTKTEVPAELLAQMEAAARIAMSNTRDPELMRQAAERMDRRREELRRLHGEMNIAVSLIREIRDDE